MSSLGLEFGIGGKNPLANAIIAPLRTIVTQNRCFVSSETRTRDRQNFRWMFVLARDCTHGIVISNNNWRSENAGETNNPNAIKIESMSFQDNSSQSVPVYFAGVRSKTLAAGDYDVQSDLILPSMFGLSKFSAGEIYWVKGTISLTSTSHQIPYPDLNKSEQTGAQVDWYNVADTTSSSVDSWGAFTYTGTAVQARSNGYCPIVLGHPDVDNFSVFVTGDSIGAGSGATTTTQANGRGSIQWMTHNGSNAGPFIPMINFCRSGNGTAQVQTKAKHYVRYARVAVNQHITNDLGSNDPTVSATVLTNLKSTYGSFWQSLKDAGAEKVIQCYRIPRTSSSNSWSNSAGQVWNNTTGSISYARCGTDGVGEQFNDWLETKVSDGTLAITIPFDNIRDATEDEKWLTNGTNNYPTADGTHPSQAIHIIMGAEGRAKLLAVAALM